MRPTQIPAPHATVPILFLALMMCVPGILEAQLPGVMPPRPRQSTDALVRQDRELAQVHVREAHALYQDGRFDEAAGVARRGLEFSQDDSDLHALLGLVYGRSVETTTDALISFERAFVHNRFTRFAPAQMAAEYAQLLQRIGRHGRALALIRSLRLDTMLYPDLLYREARALFELDRTAEAEVRASLGVRVYIDDPRFYRLLLERQPIAGYRDYLAVRRYEDDSDEYLTLLLTYADRTAATPHREQVLRRYFELGGLDPVGSLMLLEQADDPAAEFARFRSLGGDQEQDLLRRAVPLLDQATREALIAEMNAFNGELTVDRDRNGIPEERLEFRAGELVRWRLDRNQDGTDYFDIRFSEGVPYTVHHDGTTGFRALRWSIYPEVRSVRFSSHPEYDQVYHLIGDRLEVLLIDPEALAVPGTDDPEAEAVSALPQSLRRWALHPEAVLIDSATVAPQAAFVEYIRPGEQQPFRVTELVDGEPSRRVEDTIGDGAVDYIVVFRDGRRHEAMRDLLGTGAFEVLETYEDGRLRRITVTGDGDDTARFYQEFDELEIRSWDFDRDGNPDVQERYFGGDLVLRQYAGAVPGVFDLSIDFLSDILD